MMVQTLHELCMGRLAERCPFYSERLNYDLLKRRCWFIRKQLIDDDVFPHLKIHSSYPVVPQPRGLGCHHLDLDVYFACIHWLAGHDCACSRRQFRWRDIINVANYLNSNYLFLLALRYITPRNSLDMLVSFSTNLTKSSWSWMAIQIQIANVLQNMSQRCLPTFLNQYRKKCYSMKRSVPILNRAMMKTIAKQFQHEIYHGSSRHFVSVMISIFKRSHPFIVCMDRCLLYNYTLSPNTIEYFVSQDSDLLTRLRSGPEKAIEIMESKMSRNHLVECCRCDDNFVPTLPTRSNDENQLDTAAVFTPCCQTFIHQTCFLELVLNPHTCCPKCLTRLSTKFCVPAEDNLYIKIYLTSIHDRVTAHRTNTPLPLCPFIP